MIPHWAGQSEANPSYIEDWFGYVRKNEQPKPVLIAHANSARLIDGSKFVGDLWFGPKVEAMLFEKSGTHTLVLWTLDDSAVGGENVARKEITVAPGVKKVTRVDMMGREEVLAVKDGKLTLTLDESPVYLVGVSDDLAKQASKELRADRWPAPEKPPRTERQAGKLKAMPKFDGVFNDWTGAAQLSMVNPKVAGLDCSGAGYVAWDDQYLYVGVDIRDNEMLNNKPRAKLYLQDSVELFLSMKPRDTGSGYGPDDMQLFLTPASGEGKPIIGVVSDREAGTITDVAGAKFFGGKTELGWAMEVALPWSSLPAFKPAPGAKLALEMRVNDADSSHERFKIDPADAVNFIVTDPSTWSLLILKD